MSISANNTKPEDDDFADIEFRPRSARMQAAPAKEEVKEEKKPEPPATREAPREAAPSKDEAKEAPADKQAEPEATPAKEEKPAKPAKKKEKAEKPEKKKGGFFAVLFDTLLVLLLLAVLGCGGYYIKQQMELYRVPTPMEMALQENARLQKQHDELTDAYYRADEQIAMNKSLAHLNNELGRLQNECNKLQASIDTQQNNVLAMQHEIRTADKESRAIAVSLLPGMSIGNATTTRGKSLNDAYIYRLEGKLIVLRSHEGQIRVPIRELIKKDMHKMARYAFGEEDLIDMSDFDTAIDTAATEESQPREKAKPARRMEQDYEARGGSPTVDTSAGSTITAPPVQQDSGSDVSGELPF